eukprot:m.86611 g.86611  ORF g.86611 m.86611 type:complete len:53 (-) comp9671_c0_seq2:3201-3359(-)
MGLHRIMITDCMCLFVHVSDFPLREAQAISLPHLSHSGTVAQITQSSSLDVN